MADAKKSWVVLRDGARRLCRVDVQPADEMLYLACLSSDPRTLEEFAAAWLRFRPEEPLMDGNWIPLAEFDSKPQSDQVWIWIDLTECCFQWSGSDGQSLEPGGYAPLRPDRFPTSKLKRSKAQRKRDKRRGIRRTGQPSPSLPNMWLNIPQWWRRMEDQPFPEVGGDLNIAPDQLPMSNPLDFRSVLYGRPLAEFIASSVRHAGCTHTAMEGGEPAQATAGEQDVSRHDFNQDSELEQMQQRIMSEIKRIHVQWLMTPRTDLNGRMPREMLHEHRQWKDRELDHRRNQWSITRRPPPPLALTSHAFRFGPMGTEEVVHYFDLCRDAITTAWRWLDDEPTIEHAALVEDVCRFIDGWLNSEHPDSGGLTLQQLIDEERQLVPRLASSEPFDCDCPLCRLQAQESDIFGPGFSICDGYHLEMEDEFAFSLVADYEEWEQSRESFDEEWIPAPPSGSRSSRTTEQITLVTARGEPRVGRMIGLLENDDEIWKSSYVDPDIRSPQMLLFAIGMRLGELVGELRELSAPRQSIEGLNVAFDELAQSIRGWLVSTTPGGAPLTAANQAAEQMVERLERVAGLFPVLTARSADLQSLVHDWQRQLR